MTEFKNNYNEAQDDYAEDDGIAIIGMACNFPGARTVEQYWENLCNGVESITTFTDQELKESGVPLSDIQNPDYVKAKPVLEDIDLFDAQFFKYTPREASMIDPQHRVMLEVSWEALERSGYNPEEFQGKIGMYGGADMNTYLLRNLMSHPDIVENEGTIVFLTGSDKDYLCTRIAYKLNLRGPSFTVQSACSTSMVAIHLASEALLTGECDMALAGGSCISVPHKAGYLYSPGSVESPDARCRAFDSGANGTIFGSGVGVVLLKRVSDALADGDQIYSVIKGSAINNDGALRAGYTAPGVDGQARVITEALSVAGVHPESISYVEAHGTGTELGDPIETEALTQAFKRHTGKTGYCALGSVKTNFGHLSTASGVASIIKTSMALTHKKIPPSLHFEKVNPKIDLEASPFFINSSLTEWKKGKENRRLAGVSSFGIGGTNAHLILEESPEKKNSDPVKGSYQLLTLSALTKTALDKATENLADHLSKNRSTNLADAAYTLHVGRKAFKYRRVIAAATTGDAVKSLKNLDPAKTISGPQVSEAKETVFLFPGQGSQHVNMGLDLYTNEPVFKEEINRCAQLLKPSLGLDIRTLLYPVPGDKEKEEKAAEKLKETGFTQPALFMIEYALAKLWMSKGIKPAAMIGHSIGEYTAACLSGVFSLEDALMLVAERGRLMQGLPAGVMLSVPLAEAELSPLLKGSLAIGVINHPEHCVVSGPEEQVTELEKELAAKEIEGRRLHTSHAFHSPMMEPILEEFKTKFANITLNEPEIPYISNVSGSWIKPEEAVDPAYWAGHLRNTVRFADGAAQVLQNKNQVLLEAGPGNVLTSLLKHHPARDKDQGVIASMRHAKEKSADDLVFARALGGLWAFGVELDWNTIHKDEFRHRIVLPTYPFERKRYWIEKNSSNSGTAKGSKEHLFKDPDLSNWFYIPSWKRTQPPVLPDEKEKKLEGKWLLFTETGSLGETMQSYLENRGARVFRVKPGDSFKTSGNEFVINPADREDYGKLIKHLSDNKNIPTRLVHLWNCTPYGKKEKEEENPGETNEQTLDRSFYSLLYLSQELEKHIEKDKLSIAVISSAMQKVSSSENIEPEKATILGISRVIPQEMPDITIRSIDIKIPEAGSYLEEWTVKQITAEMETEQLDRITAYRGYDRLTQIYEPSPITDDSGLDGKLKKGGVYLITGGLGGIGLTLARDIAKTCGPKLVLVNRSKLPPREQWDMFIDTYDARDRIVTRIKAVKSLEALGAEVLVVSADVTDKKQMEKAVAAAKERFGTLDGVIHSAGLQDGDWIRDKTKESAQRILAPKIAGSKAIIHVCKDMDLDFIVLFSSIMSLIAIAGQADYCAGNSFIDACAMAHDNPGKTPVISIDWDEWADVGMGVSAAMNNMAAYSKKGSSESNRRKIDHPVITEAFTENENSEIYEMELNPAKQWFLAEHIRMGYSMVPATAYLDLVYASYAEQKKAKGITIKDVLFLSPFLVGNRDTKKARVLLDTNPGGTGFQLTGLQGRGTDGEDLWHTFATGELETIKNSEQQIYDIRKIRSACTKETISFGFETAEERKTVSNPRWKSVRNAYIGENEFFAEITLGDEFLKDLEEYTLHPSLLDSATGFFIDQRFIPYLRKENDNPEDSYYYLPMSYKNLRILDTIPPKFYSHVQIVPAGSSDDLTVKVSLINEQGLGFIEIEAYTLKRIKQSEAEVEEDKNSPEHINGPVRDEKYLKRFRNSIFPEEGTEVFRRIMAGNRLSQVVVCTKNLPLWLEDLKTATPDQLADVLPENEKNITLHPRPDLDTPYAEPANDVEKKLAAIWQTKLGVEKVGINDNFFELGGDSIMGIQIVAQAKQVGIALTPKSLFEHQTIAELAVLVGSGAVEDENEDTVSNEAALEYEGVEYPLTPMQQNMLYYRLNKPEAGLYLWFSIFPIRKLDVQAFEQAWQWIVKRHENLRTSFVWEGTDTPHQKIHKNVEISIEQEDLQDLAPDMQMLRIQQYIQSVRVLGFDISDVPPLRLALFKVAPDDYRFVWSINYMILDGWSYALILKEMFAYYDAHSQGQKLELEPVQSVNGYLKWLNTQDLSGAEQFFKKSLGGFLNSKSLVKAYEGKQDPDAGLNYIHSTQHLIVSPESTAALQAMSRENRLTLNTLVQGAWALVLSHLTGDDKVMFGVTSSGRSVAWDGIDSLAGFFINTLPVGMDVKPGDSLIEWLQRLQIQNSEVRQYEFTPVKKIKKWLNMDEETPYPETYMVFENFPVDSSIGVWAKRLEISETRVLVQTEHPLRIEVYPGQIIAIMFNYYQRYFPESMVTEMIAGMNSVFETMIKAPGSTLEEMVLKMKEMKEIKEIKEIKEKAVTEQA